MTTPCPTKCLVSAATGPAIDYWKYTLNPMQDFANRHNYDRCLTYDLKLDPPSWGKVPLILDLLNDYDEVLWLDADVLIVNRNEDIKVPQSAYQALVFHLVDKCHTHGYLMEENGYAVVPNCGVWFVRRKAIPFLQKVLNLYPNYRNHPWWEQGAVIDLLHDVSPMHTYRLEPKWNRHLLDHAPCDSVNFWHATACGDRLNFLREHSNEKG